MFRIIQLDVSIQVRSIKRFLIINFVFGVKKCTL